MNIRAYNLGKYVIPTDVNGGVCLEIGANVGSFFEKNANVFSKIHYYEPITKCYNICKDKSDKHNHITGYNLAGYSSSDLELELRLHGNKDSGSTALNTSILNKDWTETVIQKVKTISLEDMIKKLKVSVIDYCKSDCETSEYHIFLNKDLRNIRYIAMELHNQMGIDRWNQILQHIGNTHHLVSGNTDFNTGYNRDLLFKLK